MVEKKYVVASPFKEVDVVIQTEIICLDNDDNILERYKKLDVKVRVRDQVSCRIRKMFAN